MSYVLIDLSQEIYQGMPTAGRIQKTMLFDDLSPEESLEKTGFSFCTQNLVMSGQSGTHIQAPRAFDPSGKTVDELGLERFFGPGICLDFSALPPDAFITRRSLEEATVRAGLSVSRGDAVLIHTGYDKRGGRAGFVYPDLDGEAAEWLARAGVWNIGTDAPTVDRNGDTSFTVHRVCRKYGILATAGLRNLGKVAGRRFLFVALPLKIRRGPASPVRAAAVLPGE